MTTATKNLENDHVYILRLIDVMEKMTELKKTSIKDLESVVHLIKNFADGFHHAKEENLLFPLMATKGFSKEQGPVAVMLHDHAEGRGYVKAMSEGITKLKEGDENALYDIYANFKNYILLLREHINKENNVLFRMADRVFSEAEQEDLLTQFAEVESAGFGKGVINGYISDIEYLETTVM